MQVVTLHKLLVSFKELVLFVKAVSKRDINVGDSPWPPMAIMGIKPVSKFLRKVWYILSMTDGSLSRMRPIIREDLATDVELSS